MRSVYLLIALAMLLWIPATVVAQDEDVDTADEFVWDGITFELEDLDGDDLSEEDVFSGSCLYLVDFWASYCRPCDQYLPHLEDMLGDYSDRGFKVVIFCIDGAGSQSVARSTLEAADYPFTILFDPESEVRNDLGVNRIPTTVLFDPTGEELWRHVGYTAGDETEVREKVEENLPEAESRSESDEA